MTEPQSAPASPWSERLPAILADRELEALALLAEGATYEAIARRFALSKPATAMMLSRLYRSIGAANGTHAVALAIRAGVIE